MRFILPALLVVLLSFADLAGEELPAPVERVRFGEQEFELTWEIKSTSNNMKEFIPAGESLRKWRSFVGMYEYPLIDDPRAYAHQMAQSIKHQNPRAQCAMTYDPTTGVALVDFVTWPVDGRYIEYDVYKFQRHTSRGIVGQQFAVRDYDDKKKFFAGLDTLRQQSLKTMKEQGVVAASAAPEREAARPSPPTTRR